MFLEIYKTTMDIPKSCELCLNAPATKFFIGVSLIGVEAKHLCDKCALKEHTR